jgi:hypothetical protein
MSPDWSDGFIMIIWKLNAWLLAHCCYLGFLSLSLSLSLSLPLSLVTYFPSWRSLIMRCHHRFMTASNRF